MAQSHVGRARRILTAICGLSARTNSCGGEGSRLGGGDSGSSFFAKYFWIPCGSSTSMMGGSSSDGVGGADESDDESESARDMVEGEAGLQVR